MEVYRQGGLAGRCIVVTRPAGQADGLVDAIRAEGGTPLLFPLIGIGPACDATALAEVIAQLETFDLAFFVSPNAVNYALDAVTAVRDWPEHLVASTVGRGSLQALHARGFKQAIAPEAGFDSEAVLALPEFAPAAVRGRRVVIFRGDGGRELLGSTLASYGADVTYASCYHRYVPESDPALLMKPVHEGEVDALLFTSSEGIRNLVTIAGSACLAELRDIPVFVSHSRIAAEARTAGFSIIITAQPGDDRIITSLRHYFD